ncbi:MAG TPA: HAMP domain-containing sensor histidine kinase [Thermoleophilaceae bacterium]
MSAAALAGWPLAAVLAARAARLRRGLELAADAEHELRGAMTAFGLGVERLRRAPGGRPIAAALESELERARAGLVDLAAARTGARSRVGRSEPVALDSLARSAVAAWRPPARRLGRRVEVDWRAGPVWVRGERGRLAQALGNLLANAVEHGAGPVRLRGTRRGAAVRIEVANATRRTGAGPAMPRAGRGRGLAIAARAVESCGGTLTVAAPREGEAAVAIELPLAR